MPVSPTAFLVLESQPSLLCTLCCVQCSSTLPVWFVPKGLRLCYPFVHMTDFGPQDGLGSWSCNHDTHVCVQVRCSVTWTVHRKSRNVCKVQFIRPSLCIRNDRLKVVVVVGNWVTGSCGRGRQFCEQAVVYLYVRTYVCTVSIISKGKDVCTYLPSMSLSQHKRRQGDTWVEMQPNIHRF